MKIGDRVRLLRGTEEGRIVNIKKNKIVEIEIEDGFIIPALKNEVVLIDKQEAKSFKQLEEIPDVKEQPQQREAFPDGLYIGLKEGKKNLYESYLINQTPDTVLFVISQYDNKTIIGKTFGICENYSVSDIGQLSTSITYESKRLLVQMIFYENQTKLKKQPITKEITVTKDKLKEITYVQSISAEVSLINLEEESPLIIDPAALRDQMLGENRRTEERKEEKKNYAQHTVDLHIESSITGLKPNEILEYQLNEFEKAYDNALVMNLAELKIIHGVGAGILRKEIHKRLAKKTDVKYFEDADKERFGFGSTIIYF